MYVEYGRVRARPNKDEPDHFHLDFGYAFATADGDVGRIQESEVTGAGWYPLAEAEHLVGHRIGRAVEHTVGLARRGALDASALRRITGSPRVPRQHGDRSVGTVIPLPARSANATGRAHG